MLLRLIWLTPLSTQLWFIVKVTVIGQTEAPALDQVADVNELALLVFPGAPDLAQHAGLRGVACVWRAGNSWRR